MARNHPLHFAPVDSNGLLNRPLMRKLRLRLCVRYEWRRRVGDKASGATSREEQLPCVVAWCGTAIGSQQSER
jgi:hypothetical protein